MKNIITAIIAILFFGANFFAQDSNVKKDTMEYKYPFEVLITAPRLNVPLRESPFATSIVDENNLRNMPRTLAADEPFKLTPGIKIDNQADGERLHLS